jgi:hypothetical protein
MTAPEPKAWEEKRDDTVRMLRARATEHDRIAAMGAQDVPTVRRMLDEMGRPTYRQQAAAEHALADQIEALTAVDEDTRPQVGVQTVNDHPAIVGEDLGYLLSEHPGIDLTSVRLTPVPDDEQGAAVRIEARIGERAAATVTPIRPDGLT